MRVIRAGKDVCEVCKIVAELRPYGPNGEFVCFRCAMKDEEAAKRQFEKRMSGGLILDARNPSGPSPSEVNTLPIPPAQQQEKPTP